MIPPLMLKKNSTNLATIHFRLPAGKYIAVLFISRPVYAKKTCSHFQLPSKIIKPGLYEEYVTTAVKRLILPAVCYLCCGQNIY